MAEVVDRVTVFLTIEVKVDVVKKIIVYVVDGLRDKIVDIIVVLYKYPVKFDTNFCQDTLYHLGIIGFFLAVLVDYKLE